MNGLASWPNHLEKVRPGLSRRNTVSRAVRAYGGGVRKLRAVPADLLAVLRAMGRVEQAARDVAQHRRAAHGSAALLLAATDAGWSIPELSRALGLKDRTLHGRIARAPRSGCVLPGRKRWSPQTASFAADAR
jgi:hypothetical protein